MTKKQAITKASEASKLLESIYIEMRGWNTPNQKSDKLWNDIRMRLTKAQVECLSAITRLENQSFWE